MDIPDGFWERVEEAALKRMQEVQEIIEKFDFRWDYGFISKDEYIEKRQQLERELDGLRPTDSMS